MTLKKLVLSALVGMGMYTANAQPFENNFDYTNTKVGITVLPHVPQATTPFIGAELSLPLLRDKLYYDLGVSFGDRRQSIEVEDAMVDHPRFNPLGTEYSLSGEASSRSFIQTGLSLQVTPKSTVSAHILFNNKTEERTLELEGTPQGAVYHQQFPLRPSGFLVGGSYEIFPAGYLTLRGGVVSSVDTDGWFPTSSGSVSPFSTQSGSFSPVLQVGLQYQFR